MTKLFAFLSNLWTGSICRDAILDIPKGALGGLTYIQLQSFNNNDSDLSQVVQGAPATNYIQIDFNTNTPVSLKMRAMSPISNGAAISVYRINLENSLMTKLNPYDVTSDPSFVGLKTLNSGRYVAVYEATGSGSSVGLAVGLTVGFIFMAVVALAIGVYLTRNPKYCKLIRDTKLSFKNQI